MASTSRTTAQPTTSAPKQAAPDDQAQHLARITTALADVRTERLTIEAKQREVDAERRLIQARIEAAQRRVETVRLELARSPEAVARAKAAVLTSADAGSERAAARDLTHLQEQIATWERELDALEADDTGALATDARRLGELTDVERELERQRSEADRALALATFRHVEATLHERQAAVEAARRALDEAEEAQRTAFDHAIEHLIPWPERRDALRARFHPEGERVSPLQQVARALLSFYDVVDQEAPRLSQMVGGRNVVEIFAVLTSELNLVWSSPLGRRYTLPDKKRAVIEAIAKDGERAIFWW